MELRPNGYYAFSRPEVVDLVPPEARKILDLGCAAGELGRLLKQRQPCRVVGVEIVPQAAEKAAQVLDLVIQGDIEEIVGKPPSETFDCVICADVLEHLRDPEKVLRQLQKWLEPEGVVVASIPNVRHWSVLVQLLEGRWDYGEAGILDRSHLRFFTRTSIFFLFARAGYQIIRWASTRVPSSYPRSLTPHLREAGLKVQTLEREAGDYQYLVVARPKPYPYYRQAQGEALPASVVMPLCNGWEYTRQAVESVLRYTSLPFELILVNNGSTDASCRYLSELEAEKEKIKRKTACHNLDIIHLPSNWGFGPACNQGLARAKGEDVVLLNNDTVVTAGWLERLLRAKERDPRIGLVAPRSNYAIPVQMVEAPYDPGDLEAMHRFAVSRSQEKRGQGFVSPKASGLCLLLSRAVIDSIGGFDPRFGFGNYEDDDLCLRAHLAGFAIWIADDVFIHHWGSRTFLHQGLPWDRLMKRNLIRLRAKWLGPERSTPEEGEDGIVSLYHEVWQNQVFVPELHYEPLSPAEWVEAREDLKAVPVSSPWNPVNIFARGEKRNFLFFPRWDDPESEWGEVLEWYLRSFSPSEGVNLLLRLDPTGPVDTQEALRKVWKEAARRRLNLDGGPDVFLVNEFLPPLERGRLYRPVHLLLAPELADTPQVAGEASFFGIPAKGFQELIALAAEARR